MDSSQLVFGKGFGLGKLFIRRLRSVGIAGDLLLDLRFFSVGDFHNIILDVGHGMVLSLRLALRMGIPEMASEPKVTNTMAITPS
nr:hypothetical protein [Rhizobium laguerreae]